MNESLHALAPQPLWRYFARLAEIPRCSKQEERALAWLRAVAQEKGLPARSDDVGNLLVEVPATPGFEEAPRLILQSHIDMVCEKNAEADHDFSRDPIRILVEGDRVTADGTTLGADNGIGVATALAFLDDGDLVHGPLELLFTVDEETGLTGASQLSPDLLTGRYMVNLDSDVVGRFTIGSVGGLDTLLDFPVQWDAPPAGDWLKLSVEGLRGGHSGGDIHRQRASSIKILGRVLAAALELAGDDLSLGWMTGGSKRNAIPREAVAHVLGGAAGQAALRKAVADVAAELRRHYAEADPQIRITLASWNPPETDPPALVCNPEASRRFVWFLETLPFGVLAMSTKLPDVVETSSNVGVLFTDEDGFHLHCSTRSFTAEGIAEVTAHLRGAAHLAGVAIAHDDGYPGWTPRLDAPLLERVKVVYEELFKETPEFIGLHGGLECGLFMSKYPQLQIVSYGAKITDAHSPDEWVSVASVQKCWRFTTALVEDIARGSLD